ncbi:hypothetical protein Y046_3863 [Burkholderia pseudomallei MSHR2990]|nr:hypothetical protein Y046_3863 [Burkholderia pseudomallei MSHR2990]
MLLVRMLDEPHFGDEIGRVDERVGRMPARHDDVQRRIARGERREHFVERQVFVLEHRVQLVEDHHPVITALDHPARLVPAAARGGDVGVAVLRVPRVAVAHRDEVALRVRAEEIALGRVQRALDELHDTRAHPVAEHPHGHPERGRALALAVAGVDDQEPLLDGRGRLLLLVARAAALGHALMRFGIGFHRLESCESLGS